MSAPKIYSADLTAGSLKLRESRVIAGLLLAGATDKQFKEAVVQQNVLQARTSATAVRLARMIRARLGGLDTTLWLMIRDGDKQLSTQALLAATVRHSALLRDFMDLVLRDEYRLLHTHLDTRLWPVFLEGCVARDSAVARWSESTRQRLRSTVFQILAQAGYLSDTSKRELKKVTILAELQNCLTNRHETKILRCIQFT